MISTIGVIIFSTKDLKNIINSFFSKSTVVGLLCGTLLALSVVFYRGSMEFIDFTNKNFDRALLTLFAATIIQTSLITFYLLIFEISEFKKLKSNIKLSALAGLFGFSAIISWFYFFIGTGCFSTCSWTNKLLFSYISSDLCLRKKSAI